MKDEDEGSDCLFSSFYIIVYKDDKHLQRVAGVQENIGFQQRPQPFLHILEVNL